jgi:hypothetical protein
VSQALQDRGVEFVSVAVSCHERAIHQGLAIEVAVAKVRATSNVAWRGSTNARASQ